jgi:hypothetical protein
VIKVKKDLQEIVLREIWDHQDALVTKDQKDQMDLKDHKVMRDQEDQSEMLELE